MKKNISLKIAFWKFLFMLLIGLVASVVFPFSVLLLNVSLGVITYADYSEQMTKKLVPIIANAPDFSEIDIPMGCEYVRTDKDYRVIQTNLEDDALECALNYAKTGRNEGSLNMQYILVTRQNEYVVLQYSIGSRYINEWLNIYLPSPEMLLYIMIIINCVVVSAVLTTRFSKNLRTQLSPLFEATEKVSNHDLNFQIGHSKIKEFEQLIICFSEMKMSLKKTLEMQWKAEEMQREQIAAMAHDLKTPLTVIQGNADLINETILDSEQKMYVDYILESSEQMQIYIGLLIDITKSIMGQQLNRENINISTYIKSIEKQIDSLCRAKKIQLELSNVTTTGYIRIDRLQIERAIMNVVNNAIEHSKEGGKIYCDFCVENKYLMISVTDEGTGFSKEALLHAQECFFMDDLSRNSRMHFGMGLYITASIIEQHKGKLILENSVQTNGAKVIIKIPVR